ncbi:MAG: HU family DNA-binding protein [Alkalispirochaeta sp.]
MNEEQSPNRKDRNLPPEIEDHLLKLMKSLDLPVTEESFRRFHDAWLEKERLFAGQTKALDMESPDSLEEGDPRGCILLTNSGSLLSLSPESSSGRWMEYASIPIRSDVPDILKGQDVALQTALVVGSPAVLTHAPLKQTSPLYRIAVCAAGTPPAEQEKRIREGTIFLTNGFAKINKTVVAAAPGSIDHFTKQSMIAYVAERNDLTQKQTRSVIDDYFTTVESGVRLGEKVPLGGLGKVSYKIRPPQKARVITNPATGEEITVPAKPRTAAVKFTASSSLKALVSAIPVDTDPVETEDGDNSI